MTQRKQLMRDMVIQVQAADGITWLAIAGRTDITINPAENEETTDTTDMDSDGEWEGIPTQRGGSIEIEGFLMADHITDAEDPGQTRCMDLAALKGYDALGGIRFRRPAGTAWKVWPTALFSVGEQSGDNNAVISWSCTVTRSGASTTEAV
ncbi:phage tail tube protein [Actinophytocola sediminis]